MNAINTLLFDLDGTLVDTNEIIIRSYLYTFKTHLPQCPITREEIIDHIGPPLDQIFSKYTDSSDQVTAMIDTYREFYVNNEFSHFKLYDGVIDTLKTLKHKGYNLAIVTSKFMVSARPSIEFFELDTLMDAIITLDDVRAPKPNREPIDIALKQFCDVTGALMIGDNTTDIEAGNAAGISSAGVEWSIKGPALLKTANPTYMLRTMTDLYAILDINEEE